MAIAFDNATAYNGATGSSSYTYSHTCGAGASLRVGVLCVQAISSITYNGVAMTFVKDDGGPGGVTTRTYELKVASSGANNVVITLGANESFIIESCAQSHTGDTGQEVSAFNTLQGSTANMATTVTTVTNNDWLIGFASSFNGFPNVGASTTARVNSTNMVAIDSNGVKSPAGSYALNVTNKAANSDWVRCITMGVKPKATNGGNFIPYFM